MPNAEGSRPADRTHEHGAAVASGDAAFPDQRPAYSYDLCLECHRRQPTYFGRNSSSVGGGTVGGKSLRDHMEAIDHAKAWDAMLHRARASEPVTPWMLRSLHSLVLRRSHPDTAGKFRSVPVAIAGSGLVPQDPSVVTPALDDLMGEWNNTTGHPVTVGAEMYARLMAIHPFFDGNGRAGRLLLNFWLMRNQYLPACWSLAIGRNTTACCRRRIRGICGRSF